MELLNLNIPSWSDLAYWRPEAILCGTFLAALVGDLIVRGKRPGVSFAISVFGLITAGAYAIAAVGNGNEAHTIMGDLVIVDGMAVFFRLLFIFAGLATVLFAWTSEEIMGRTRENKGEFFYLLVLMTVAMTAIASGTSKTRSSRMWVPSSASATGAPTTMMRSASLA